MPPESSFQLKLDNTKYSIVLWDAQMPQKTKDRLSFLLQGEYSNIISMSPMHVGRTNLFQKDIPTIGPPFACKPYPSC